MLCPTCNKPAIGCPHPVPSPAATRTDRIARLVGSDRHELADAYDDHRAYVMSRTRGSQAHAVALDDLSALAALLHAAERAACVPIGSTRDAS